MKLKGSEKNEISRLIDIMVGEITLIAYESEGLRYMETDRIKEEFFKNIEKL
ncbi:MAG: hypothetical protein Q8N08_05710 [Methanobacteriaceae archaeon]|nr:hypothetical protein [Methanobacteriaceae archaeon]